jgi:hypothetical protein
MLANWRQWRWLLPGGDGRQPIWGRRHTTAAALLQCSGFSFVLLSAYYQATKQRKQISRRAATAKLGRPWLSNPQKLP